MKRYVFFGFGGVAEGVVNKLVAEGAEVVCVSRKKHTLPGVTFKQANIMSDDIGPLFAELFSSQKVDCIVNTIGMLHAGTQQPEKALSQVCEHFLMENIRVNVLPTIRIAQGVSAFLNRQSSCKFIAFSARLASISDNHLGGWYSYRMSKTMLNMFIKNLSIEWGRSFPGVTIAGYHPGTVDTALSKPFQRFSDLNAVFSPSKAADYFLRVLKELNTEDSGQVFDWRGEVIDC